MRENISFPAVEELSEGDPIKRRIDFVIASSKEKPVFGQPIAKSLIPQEYSRRGIDNAFWVELSKSKDWMEIDLFFKVLYRN